jgi:peptidoglycan/LPS O-acetylase OafA/YrhL
VRGDDPALTAVRGIAAFWVFVYHAWLTAGPQLLTLSLASLTIDLTPFASVGWAGVDIFYVLSGFLLWSVFERFASRQTDSLGLGRFAKRRALRILPAYYAQLAVLVALAFATNLIPRPTAGDVAAHLTLTHALSWDYLLSMNGVWWTLSIEAQFYVALPILALAVRRLGWPAILLGGFFLMLAWRIGAFELVRNDPIPKRVWLIEQFPGRLDQFLLGMFAQHATRAASGPLAALRAWLRERRAIVWLIPLSGIASLIALAYALHIDNFYLRYWDGHPSLFVWHTAAAAAVALSLYAISLRGDDGGSHALSTSGVRRAVAAVLVALGTVSYSLYLWHEVLLRLIGPHLYASFANPATPAAFATTFFAGFAICITVATLWYLLFEAPFLNARARLRAPDDLAAP